MHYYQKDWQVEAQGRVYEADFDELRQWILEGAIMPTDRVKRGNLRWLHAEKVPELNTFFSDFKASLEQEARNGESVGENLPLDAAAAEMTPPAEDAAPIADEGKCSAHPELEADFVCVVCKTPFCKRCPNSFGGVKICPLCGSMCHSISESLAAQQSIGTLNRPYNYWEQNKLELHAAGSRQTSLSREPLGLILAIVLFALILSAAFFMFFTPR